MKDKFENKDNVNKEYVFGFIKSEFRKGGYIILKHKGEIIWSEWRDKE